MRVVMGRAPARATRVSISATNPGTTGRSESPTNALLPPRHTERRPAVIAGTPSTRTTSGRRIFSVQYIWRRSFTSGCSTNLLNGADTGSPALSSRHVRPRLRARTHGTRLGSIWPFGTPRVQAVCFCQRVDTASMWLRHRSSL
jgi:hypothetical protein